MDKNSLLSCHHLSIARANHILLENWNMELCAGDSLQILGENGAGKSSLLRALAGLLPPLAGTVSASAEIFYLGHDNAIKTQLTVLENILWDARYASYSIEKIEAALDYFDLSAKKHLPAAKLSAGQTRRLTLVKCYLSTAKIYILDEPLSALDVNAQAKCRHMLLDKLAQGAALVFTSHQQGVIPAKAGIHLFCHSAEAGSSSVIPAKAGIHLYL